MTEDQRTRAAITARVSAFEAVHRPHGASAHHCRDVERNGPLCFHAQCPRDDAEILIPIATATGEPLT